MSVLGRLLIGSGQRVDLQDLLSIDSYSAGDIKYLIKGLFGDTKPYIARGFDIINPESAIGSQSCSIRVADSVVFYPGSGAGSFFHGLEEGNSYAEPLVPELRKNAVNYVYLTFSTKETATDTKAFWDPDKDGGLGGEFAQDVNTESVLSVEVNVSVSSFPQNTVPIAKITVGPVVISAIEDCRNMLFRLATGGLSVDPFSKYSWRSLPNTGYERTEPATKMLGGGVNPFQGADKNIYTLKEWMDAVMTKLQELGGTTYWYEDASTYSLMSGFIDSCATAFQSKGKWLHDESTPGLIVWTEDINIKVTSDIRNYILRAGNKTLDNEQVVYVEMIRNKSINDNNDSVNWVNGSSIVNSVGGIVGSFENLSQGDYIKKLNDTNDKYLRVEGFRDALNGGGSSVISSLARSIILSAPYQGSTGTEKGIYDKGVYSGSDIEVADRNDSNISLIGGNFHWIAVRSDTIQSVSNIQSTELTVSLSEDDGVTVKVTSSGPHGLDDGERIYISGSTNFDGEYIVEKETNDIFYINKGLYSGPYADESGVSACFATVTTTFRYAQDGALDGIQLESDKHNFSTNDKIIISDTTSYNGSYRIRIKSDTQFTIPVAASLASETSGTATLVRTILRTESSVIQVAQGGSASIGGSVSENMRQYVGMQSLAVSEPVYLVPVSYNTIDGWADYNCDSGENLTTRLSKLTSMMADKAQDKTIKFSASGYKHIKNTTSGLSQQIQFIPTSTGSPKLDIVLPSSYSSGYITLSGTLSLNTNEVAYVSVDRNDSFSYANLSLLNKSNISATPIDENIFVFAYRLSNTDIWLWDGTRVVADTLATQAIEYVDTIPKVNAVDNYRTSLPTGASVIVDGVTVNSGDKILFTTAGLNGIYLANGSGSVISSWQQIEQFSGNLAPYDGALVSCQSGTAGYATTWIYSNTKWRQLEHTQINKEPTGFVDISESTIAFNNATRVFTISPSSSYFDIYQKGVPYRINSSAVTTISDTDGLHYIYFNNGSLSNSSSFDINFIKDYVLVATVQWDATNNLAIMLSEERHGLSMDGATHAYLHQSIGTRYVDGLTAGDYIIDGDGTSNSHATLSISNGLILDEDISINIQSGIGIVGSNPTTGQTLNPIAYIPVYYRASSGQWRKDSATAYPVKLGSTYITYNLYSGGTWTTPDTSNNNFVAMWVFATNNIAEPVIAVLGQRQDATLNDAQQNNTYENLSFGAMPSLEMKVIYRLIFEVSSSYTNTVKAVLADIKDMRRAMDVSLGTHAPSDHGLLTGLTDQDHPDYSIFINDPSSYVGGLKQISSTDNDDVEKALNSLDRFFAQLKIRPHATNTNRVIVSSTDQELTNQITLIQSARGLVVNFTGAQIDFASGQIFAADGVTLISTFSAPVTSPGQYRWYSITAKESTVNADNTINLQVLIKAAASTGLSPTLAPKAGFSQGTQVGAIVINGSVSGINPITASSIRQLGAGSSVDSSIFTANTSDAGIYAGNAVYLDSTGKAYLVDNTNDNKIEFIGIALDNGGYQISVQSTGEIEIDGAQIVSGAFTIGEPVYINSSGKLTSIAPNNTGQWVIQAGIATSSTRIVINGAGSATAVKLTSDNDSYVYAAVREVSTTQNILNGDSILLVTTGSSTITLTLPSPISGKIYNIKKIDAGSGSVVINTTSANIDGQLSKTIVVQYQSLTIASSASEYYII